MQYHCLHITGIMSPLIMSDVGLMLMWTSYFLDNMYFIASRCRKFFCLSTIHPPYMSKPSQLCLHIAQSLLYTQIKSCCTWSLPVHVLRSSTLPPPAQPPVIFFFLNQCHHHEIIHHSRPHQCSLLTWLKLDLKLEGGGVNVL